MDERTAPAERPLTIRQRCVLAALSYRTVPASASALGVRVDVLRRLDERGLVKSQFGEWFITDAGLAALIDGSPDA